MTDHKQPTAQQIEESRSDTRGHISWVRYYINHLLEALAERGKKHDASKLEDPELPMFAYYGPRLRGMEYGSDEYKTCLAEMKEQALDHHYECNSHHPEHYPNGISGMNLVDLLEMLADWKAATLRMANGDLSASITLNIQRFGITPQVAQILKNTALLLDIHPIDPTEPPEWAPDKHGKPIREGDLVVPDGAFPEEMSGVPVVRIHRTSKGGISVSVHGLVSLEGWDPSRLTRIEKGDGHD